MLSFTRRLSESFIIGEDIVVKVLGYDEYGNIRIGVDAPESVSVHREEIYRKIKSQSSKQ